MDDKSNSIEIAFQEIVSTNNLAIDLVEQLMAGYEQGRWSSRRVQRDLDIERVEFWYIKAYYGIAVGGSPDLHYLSDEDEKQAELDYQQHVGHFLFGDGEKPIKADSNESTLKRVGTLMKRPLRRTILVPLNHDVIIELQKLNRLDVLSIDKWETHTSKVTLLVASHSLGFKESLRMMRALPTNIVVNDERYKLCRSAYVGIEEEKAKMFSKVVSNVANTDLATDIQDDAELNIDTIYLTDYKVNKTIDSRNFMVNIESLIQLVDEK